MFDSITMKLGLNITWLETRNKVFIMSCQHTCMHSINTQHVTRMAPTSLFVSEPCRVWCDLGGCGTGWIQHGWCDLGCNGVLSQSSNDVWAHGVAPSNSHLHHQYHSHIVSSHFGPPWPACWRGIKLIVQIWSNYTTAKAAASLQKNTILGGSTTLVYS